MGMKPKFIKEDCENLIRLNEDVEILRKLKKHQVKESEEEAIDLLYDVICPKYPDSFLWKYRTYFFTIMMKSSKEEIYTRLKRCLDEEDGAYLDSIKNFDWKGFK